MIDRKRKEIKTEVDLSIPLNLEKFKLAEDDCFGKEWSPQHKECSTCHDSDVCGIIYTQLTLKNKVKEVEGSQNAKFLDLVNFKRIDKKALYSEIESKSGEINVESVIKYIKHYSRCSDDESVITWLKNFKEEYNLKIKKGVISV